MDLEANAVSKPAKLLEATSGLLSDYFRPIFSTSELLLSPLQSLSLFSLGKMLCNLR